VLCLVGPKPILCVVVWGKLPELNIGLDEIKMSFGLESH